MIWGTFDDNMLQREVPVNYTNEIAALAAAWINLVQPNLSRMARNWEYQPNLCERPVTQAFITLDEALPPLLLQYFSDTASDCVEILVRTQRHGPFDENL